MAGVNMAFNGAFGAQVTVYTVSEGVTEHLASHRAACTGSCVRYRSSPTWCTPS